jgi:hypothetical protein
MTAAELTLQNDLVVTQLAIEIPNDLPEMWKEALEAY